MRGKDLLTIGELARLTSVPVKTIRHYSDLGVLPPRQVTRSRYRMYHHEDRFRLEVIRLLRSLDFDLETIRALLARRRPARETMRLQLDAVDAGLRRLRRTRAVLARALESDSDADVLDSLRRLHAIAVLDSAERGALLRGAMEGHLRGVPIDQAWKAQLWDAAFARLPDELDDAQWRALFELTELVEDEDFGRTFWQLVALVRGWPTTPPPRARAFKWLFAALAAQKP